MNAAAVIAPISPGNLEEAIAQLPAEARAQLAWLPNALRQSLRRLLEAETLTRELVAHEARAVLQVQAAFRTALEALVKIDLTDFQHALLKRAEQQAQTLRNGLPRDLLKPALRALFTGLWLGGMGIALANKLGPRFQEAIKQGLVELETNEPPAAVAGLHGFVLISAVLEAIDGGKPAAPGRLAELANLADTESLAFAEQLRAGQPPELRVSLPWYFEPTDGSHHKYPFALWFEQRGQRNRRAIELLDEWAAGDAEEQRATWDFLKKAMDENRSSNRPLFPPKT